MDGWMDGSTVHFPARAPEKCAVKFFFKSLSIVPSFFLRSAYLLYYEKTWFLYNRNSYVEGRVWEDGREAGKQQ